jgi:hypothetical protein
MSHRACILNEMSMDCPTSPFYKAPSVSWYEQDWVVPTSLVGIFVVALAILAVVALRKQS